MSLEKRKIGHYTIEMTDGENSCFDSQLLKDFLFDLVSTSRAERLVNNRKQNKALLLYNVSEDITSQDRHIINVTFVSCKYNHAPDYMSSTDGTERATIKRTDEGEEELTHFSIELRSNEGYIVFEERRSGVSIGTVMKYLGEKFADYQNKIEAVKNYSIQYFVIAHEDFMTKINTCSRICSAELYTDKDILGDEFVDFAGLSGTLKEELIISMMPQRGQTINRRLIDRIHQTITRRAGRISRMRVKIKDDEGVIAILDTLNGKRKDEVTVDLNANGTVNSNSIFRALKEVITGNGQ